MTCVPRIMGGNSLNTADVNCISRRPYQKGIDKNVTRPFKDASAQLKMILEPLSLFTAEQPPKDLLKEFPETKLLEKYETDISCYDDHGLLECVEKQLQLKQHSQRLPLEEQQELIDVIMIEATHIEPYIEEQINNPSLGPIQQKKLRSVLHQAAGRICEHLFLRYADMAQVLNERGIFSGTANICRIRTQLTMDAAKILSVQGVKQMSINMNDVKMDSSLTRIEEIYRLALLRHTDSGVSEAIAAIIKQMPSINLEGLPPACLYSFSQVNKQSRSTDIPTYTDQRVTDDNAESGRSQSSESFTLSRRCSSQPELSNGETIWDELDTERPSLKRCASLENHPFNEFETNYDWEEQNNVDMTALQSATLINQDLYKLLRCKREYSDLDSLILDDMPPLIKAVPGDEKRRKAREKLDQQIQELYEKEKLLKEKSSLGGQEPAFDQPTVWTTQLSTQIAARTTNVRVSKRVKGVDHHLISKCPQYNDLLGDMDSDSTKSLDRPLFEEKDLVTVFNGFLDSMKHGDIFVDTDTTFTDVPSGLDLSDTLKNRERHLLNKKLCQYDDPPWRNTYYNQWVLQPQKVVVLNNEEIQPRVPDLSQPEKKDRKDLKYWRHWWKSIVRCDDYLKYLCLQETDFLRVIFHLFDNEVVEEEGDKLIAERSEMASGITDSALKAPDEKSMDGRTPTTPEPPVNMVQVQGRLNKMWSALQLTESQKIEMAMSYATDDIQYSDDKRDSADKRNSADKRSSADKRNSADKQKEIVLSAWEKSAQFIVQRETIMADLLVFESEASDPNRFFVRGPGNANLRLQEAKTRSRYYKRIEHLDKKITKHINMMQTEYGEVVKFQDRPYLEKMKWDRIEMLYWLQESRKLNALHYESKKLHIELPQMTFKQLILSDNLFTK